MTDNIKFIYAESKNTFDSQKDTINPSSIVFIADTKQIFTHGQFYSCPYTAEEINNLFNGRIKVLEDVIETEGDGSLFLTNNGTYRGITVNNNDTNANYELMFHSEGNLYGTSGVYCNPSNDSLYATHFYETSDVNYKMNIESITNSDNCPIVKEFNWKTDGTKSYGFIAQELEKQGYKELVNTDVEGKKTVNYSAALSLTIGKMQKRINELEQKLQQLENIIERFNNIQQ